MKIVSTASMRSMEQQAVSAGIPEYRLMRRAGEGAAALISSFAKGRFRRAVFFCGAGNNAGDAIVCAGLLDLPHVILPFRCLNELKGAAAEAVKEFGPKLNTADPEHFDFAPGDLIIDALLGIGFKGGSVRSPLDKALKMIKESCRTVIAFDLPSGLDGDTGDHAPETAAAAMTITFGAPKQGLFLKNAPMLCGKIEVVPIGTDTEKVPAALPYGYFCRQDAFPLPQKTLDSHKNNRGRVLVLCGSMLYPGAAVLAASGALRFAGIVRLLTVKHDAPLRLPAALISRYAVPEHSGALPANALKENRDFVLASDVLCAGCGWGPDTSPLLLADVLKFPGTVVLDADGINLLSRNPDLWQKRPGIILTPHPGEAKRLAEAFGVDTEAAREEFAAALAEKLGAVVVLKGFHTCVSDPDGGTTVNGSGGPELAMAGSGDVLAGIIAALAAGGRSCIDAARLGVFLHGMAGDMGHGRIIADELPELAAEAADLQIW